MTEAMFFPEHARVQVVPFTRQQGREEVIIGRPDGGAFLAVPPEATQLLDDLANGLTVAETSARYLARHGETPDLQDFLELLARKGFVQPPAGSAPTFSPQAVPRAHFEWIPAWFARAVFGRLALALYAVVIGVAALAVIHDSSLLPTRQALYFERHHTVKILIVVALSFVTLFFHELGHLLAARAVGVSARMGIGHRLWILVAETDLTGLWALPKGARYLPFLAGPLVDCVCAAAVLLVLAAERQAWLGLDPSARELLRALLFSYWLQLFWQVFFFVRTDLYYVLATAFDCKNLLGDTEAYLRTLMARLRRTTPQGVHQIPPREQRLIRAYAFFWVLGRAAAFSLMFTLTLPLTLAYVRKVSSVFSAGFAADRAAWLDAAVLLVFSLSLTFAGFALWLRSLVRNWRTAS